MAARLLPPKAAAFVGIKEPGREKRNVTAVEIKTDFALKQKLLVRHFFHLDAFPKAGKEIGGLPLPKMTWQPPKPRESLHSHSQ